MNFAYFIAKRISYKSHRSFSRVIIRVSLSAVALSLATMLITVAIVLGFQGEIKNKVTAFAAHIQISKIRTSSGYENEPVNFDPNLIREIKAIPEVKHVQVFATKPGLLRTQDASMGIVLKGVDKDFNWDAFRPRIREGRPIAWNDTAIAREIVISQFQADAMKLKVGDKIRLYFIDPKRNHRIRSVTVVGIYQTSIEEFDKFFVLGDLRDVQRLNLQWAENQVGGYEVFLKTDEHVDEVSERIRFLKGIDVDMDTQTVQARYPQIYDWLNLLNMHIEIILSLMGVVAAINMVTTLIIMILERTTMIGLLKALGAKDWTLRKIFILNAFGLILLGLMIGNGIGLGLLLLQKYTHFFKLNESQYYLSEVPVYLNWTYVGLINLGAFLFCALAMLLPSLLVTRVRPVKALRFD